MASRGRGAMNEIHDHRLEDLRIRQQLAICSAREIRDRFHRKCSADFPIGGGLSVSRNFEIVLDDAIGVT